MFHLDMGNQVQSPSLLSIIPMIGMEVPQDLIFGEYFERGAF